MLLLKDPLMGGINKDLCLPNLPPMNYDLCGQVSQFYGRGALVGISRRFVTALLPGEDEDAEELDGYHGQGELGNGGPGHPQLHLQYSDLQYTVSLNAVLRG